MVFGLGACATTPETTDPSAGANSAVQADSATTTMTSTAPATTSTATPTATPSATAQALSSVEENSAVGPFGTERTQASPVAGTDLVLAGVRAGDHEGYDRVVFEFEGAGTPGYVAGYVPEPLQQASGNPIEVNGNAYLEVMVQGTPMGRISTDDALVRTGPMDTAAGTVQGVTNGGVFEDTSQFLIGLDQQRPYHLYVLQNPTRIVVDIQK